MNDELFFEVLEDPEMTEVGQRLIMQGGELLDDTDLSLEERRKVEKIFSECWEDLREIKGLRDALLKTTQDYRRGQAIPGKKGLDPREIFRAFVIHSIKVLDHLIRMLGPLTQGNISWKSYLKHRVKILKSLECLDQSSLTRSQALAQVIQEGESYWIESLARLYKKIEEDGNLEKLVFVTSEKHSPKGLLRCTGRHQYIHANPKGAMTTCERPRKNSPLHKGRQGQKLTLDGGELVDEIVIRTWKNLIDFCEDFIAHAIQLRFLEIIEGLEVIPHHMQDPVYPRRFKVILRRASRGSGETES